MISSIRIVVSMAVCIVTIIFFQPAYGSIYNGDWSGTTTQGDPVSFTVVDDEIQSFKIGIQIDGRRCITEKTIQYGGIYLSANTFSHFGQNYNANGHCYDAYTLSGTFSDDSNCSGSYSDEACHCDGSETIGWAVTRKVEPDISVEPKAKMFINIAAGGSDTQTFTIENSGNDTLLISDLSIIGANADEFSLENDTCSNINISARSSCTVDIRFSPTSTENKSADLLVMSNDPDTPTLSVPLGGYQHYCAATPYFEDYSTGKPLNSWEYYSSHSLGRIEVVDEKLRMNVAVDENDFLDEESLNEAILCLDLQDRKNVQLSFYQSQSGFDLEDLPDSFNGHANGDGVSISNDGTTWHTIVNASSLEVGETGDTFTIALDAEVSRIQSTFDASFGYTAEFKIKFQQYDNFSFFSDNHEWDDISVISSPSLDSVNMTPVFMLLLE